MSAVSPVANAQHQGPMGDTFWAQASCRGPHQEIFFPPSVTETRRSKRRREARAKEICATCTIRDGCLSTALRRNEQHGIWGGQTAKERRTLLLQSSS